MKKNPDLRKLYCIFRDRKLRIILRTCNVCVQRTAVFKNLLVCLLRKSFKRCPEIYQSPKKADASLFTY